MMKRFLPVLFLALAWAAPAPAQTTAAPTTVVTAPATPVQPAVPGDVTSTVPAPLNVPPPFGPAAVAAGCTVPSLYFYMRYMYEFRGTTQTWGWNLADMQTGNKNLDTAIAACGRFIEGTQPE